MTGHDEALSVRAIELCRGLQRKTAAACEAMGVTLEDVSVAAAFAAMDVAQRRFADPFAAVEFLRTAADLFERQLMSGETKQ